MTKNDKLLHDLTRHLRDKVLDNVSDHMDTCKRAGLAYPEVASELMVFFSYLASGYAAFQFKIDEDEFIHIMRIQFRQAVEQDK